MTGRSKRLKAAIARIMCARGDLTRQEVDAIVNAANESLRGGGGVDGAIHRAAGGELLRECVSRYPDGCPTGDARWTRAYGLPCSFVIHTVGPIWRGGSRGEEDLLRSCHRRSIEVASELGVAALAFPAISCGVYGYPPERAAPVALRAAAEALDAHERVREVRFVLFTEQMLVIFEKARRELLDSLAP
ncbi:MAG: O-acetyl-ADP-ribose deacetylase [Planctomycetota bacterium]